jgi:filamentous hemagglutinin
VSLDPDVRDPNVPGTTVQSRVDELRASIPENSKGRVTMAAAVVEDSAGQRAVLIGTSEPRGYLRPGVELRPGERVVAGSGHAEADIVSHATANELKIISIGATRPVCPECQQAILPTRAEIVTPLKSPRKPKP